MKKRKAVSETNTGSGWFSGPSETPVENEKPEIFIKNSVLICVVHGHLLILKDKWEKWNFEANVCNHTFKEFKKNLQ